MIALNARRLSVQFGGLKCVSEVDLEVAENSIVGLIGPNGAGKTTVFNLLTGVYRPTSGSVTLWEHHRLEGLKPYAITRLGLARTFQNIRLFKGLSVLQNLLIASDVHPQHQPAAFLNSLFRSRSFFEVERKKKDFAVEILKVFGLETRLEELAKNLPYGDQRRLEIARALATGAKLILLDEPAAGLNPNETVALMKTIRSLRDVFKATVLLIEHDMKLVMGICEKIVVLDHGIKIAEGNAQEIKRNPLVIEAYLGKTSHK